MHVFLKRSKQLRWLALEGKILEDHPNPPRARTCPLGRVEEEAEDKAWNKAPHLLETVHVLVTY